MPCACGAMPGPARPGLVPYCPDGGPRCESDGEADANWPGAPGGGPPPGSEIDGREFDGIAWGWAFGIWLIDVGSPSKSTKSSASGDADGECLRGGAPGGLDGGGWDMCGLSLGATWESAGPECRRSMLRIRGQSRTGSRRCSRRA